MTSLAKRRLLVILLAAVAAVGTVSSCSKTQGTGPAHASSSLATGILAGGRESDTGPCTGAAGTPGGHDRWGTCWPGPGNTGPAKGVSLTPYRGNVTPSGTCIITRNTVIAAKKLHCQIIVRAGNLKLEDSKVDGVVHNYGHGSVLIADSTIDGGTDQTETVLGRNTTVIGSNLYGDQHEVYCSGNCTIKNSWLHDNHNFGKKDHQNGFLSTGGKQFTLLHNTIACNGHCTADVSLLGSSRIARISRNLMSAANNAAYCLYPSSGGSTSVTVNRIVVTVGIKSAAATGRSPGGTSRPTNAVHPAIAMSGQGTSGLTARSSVRHDIQSAALTASSVRPDY